MKFLKLFFILLFFIQSVFASNAPYKRNLYSFSGKQVKEHLQKNGISKSFIEESKIVEKLVGNEIDEFEIGSIIIRSFQQNIFPKIQNDRFKECNATEKDVKLALYNLLTEEQFKVKDEE